MNNEVYCQEIVFGTIVSKVESNFLDSTVCQMLCMYDKKSHDTNLLISNKQKELLLKSAIDDSETIENPRVFVATGRIPNTMFIFGGTIAYWITSDLHIKNTLELNRELCDSEFWTIRTECHVNGLLVVYEGGMFLLNTKLELLWHHKKFFNDHLRAVGQDIFTLENDEGEIVYSIKDGHPL